MRVDLRALPMHRLLAASWAADELFGFGPALRAVESAGLQVELADLLAGEWADRVDGLLQSALELLATEPDETMTSALLEQLLADIGDTLGPDFEDAVGATASSLIREAYLTGRHGVLRPLKIGFVDQLVDQRAQTALESDSLYWIGSYWDRDLGQSIADSLNSTVLQKGLSRGDAGVALQALLGGDFPDKSARYWELVASAGVQRASVFGSIGSFRQTGVQTVRFVNPNDLRTSEVCSHLSGMVFPAEIAYRVVDDFVSARSPEEAKQAQPWPNKAQILATRDPRILGEIGVVPPLHGHCRSVLVPASWDSDDDA